ncbi:MAG: hypothetical protein ACJ790_01625 [Myxococcaceae bacterium]
MKLPQWKFALLSLFIASASFAQPHVTIEKATVPWDELVQLIREEGRAPPPVRTAPTNFAPVLYSLPSVDVSGEVEDGVARLTLVVTAEVLANRWTMVPLLPETFAVSRADVIAPGGSRGILVRDRGVSLAAERSGSYKIVLSVEGTLEQTPAGQRLSLPLREIAGGAAHLTLSGVTKVSGASAWKLKRTNGALVADAALGGPGLELIIPAQEQKRSSAGALEELDAITVVSLGGSGVGRMRLLATPAESGILDIELPERSRAWKVYVGSSPLPQSALAGRSLKIPLKTTTRIELAWTFDMPPMGIRGRYRVELPKLPMPVRGAQWAVYLPDGLTYSETQAALSPSGACTSDSEALTPLQPEGSCAHYGRAVLDSGRAWIEGNYSQNL